MMKKIFITCAIFFLFSSLSSFGQNNFNPDTYIQFLNDNQNLTSNELISQHTPSYSYYKGTAHAFSTDEFSYLDSILTCYQLTQDEIDLLKTNYFVVTERLSFDGFGRALHNIYEKDLPVMVTTDAVLHALHMSYDCILMDLEIAVMEPKLDLLLDALYNQYPDLLSKYAANASLQDPLRDVDLYITIAKSLLNETLVSSQYKDAEEVRVVWDAIQSEKMVCMPLFSERDRRLDFSQFTVRGHYTRVFWDPKIGGTRTLGNYFKSMMWLGRIDFWMTPPPENPSEEPWTREQIRRMNLGAVMLNELVDLAGVRSLLDEIDAIIRKLVGESDNLTPEELSQIVEDQQIQSTVDLMDDAVYDAFQEALISSMNFGQRILSNFFIMNPFSTTPDTLPVSFRLLGQRFIVDSYVFSNVVYDRIVYQGNKVWRPMPDPLDAIFVLGNDNALPLLKTELDEYHYASELAGLRYLVDAYDSDFWDQSLYNAWLQAIRHLSSSDDRTGFPFFMKTAAWQQEKLNTQLASWAQLRHDNLLYAKQSYTGGTVCSFPHSYVEPYPSFYRQIADFAEQAGAFFSQFSSDTYELSLIKDYFPRLKNVMLKLETLARKELNNESFTPDETEFLKKMLFIQSGSGAPPFSGWYAELYYRMEDSAKEDFIVADVHTQPTDISGVVVGRVLHVGVGQVNLGVFLVESPSNGYQPMAYVGPVMSYYEKITNNFKRHTDEEWKDLVQSNNLPARPDWVNIYLSDENGNPLPPGRELNSVIYTGIEEPKDHLPDRPELFKNHPNPFNPRTAITYGLTKSRHVELTVFNLVGRKIVTLVDEHKQPGRHTVYWNAIDVPSGIYVCRIRTEKGIRTIKMMLLK